METRTGDLPGLVPPTWESVQGHGYRPWTEPQSLIDTAILEPEEAASQVCAEIALRRRQG